MEKAGLGPPFARLGGPLRGCFATPSSELQPFFVAFSLSMPSIFMPNFS